MLTFEEAKRCVADEKPGHSLTRTAQGQYRLARPDGSWVGPPDSNLVRLLVVADVPIPVRDEDEATVAVQAKTNDYLLEARQLSNGEKLVGTGTLLSEKRPGANPQTMPLHGIDDIRARGKTWKEALAPLGLRVCD